MATWDDVGSIVGGRQLTDERSPREWRVGLADAGPETAGRGVPRRIRLTGPPAARGDRLTSIISNIGTISLFNHFSLLDHG
jgi:hypothetical protein